MPQDLSGGILRVPLDVNRPPSFVAGGGFTVNVGDTAGTTFRAIDLGGDSIEYSATNLPANTSFNPATRVLSMTPTVAQAGQTYSNVTITASDGRDRSPRSGRGCRGPTAS